MARLTFAMQLLFFLNILNNSVMNEKMENQKESEFIQKGLRENHELRQA